VTQRVVTGLLVALTCAVGCIAGCSTATPTSKTLPSSSAVGPSTPNTLLVQGPVTTDSNHEVVGSGRACSFGPPLSFQTNAMSLPNGRVVRVAFTIAAQGSSSGSYSPTSPRQEYGYTPLTLNVAANAATGVGATINASSGLIVVLRADAANGVFSGTVDAVFADGTHLTGGWLCRVGE
jgi:hypothetical protein